jgi:hypothetical protein
LVAILVITPIVEILILAVRQLNQLLSEPSLIEREKKERERERNPIKRGDKPQSLFLF